jgi:predicted GTPase
MLGDPMTYSDEEITEAVAFLMNNADRDVRHLTIQVCEALGVDLVDWAKEAPEEVIELAEAARDMLAQAPAEEMQSFTSFKSLR